MAEVRSSLAEKPVTTEPGEKPAGRTYKTKHGTTAQMDTEGVADSGKKRAKPKAEEPKPEPPADDEGVDMDDLVEALLAANAQLKEGNPPSLRDHTCGPPVRLGQHLAGGDGWSLIGRQMTLQIDDKLKSIPAVWGSTSRPSVGSKPSIHEGLRDTPSSTTCVGGEEK